MRLLLPTLLLAASPALVQAPTYPYHIKGQLGHYDAPAKIYLVYNQGIDSAALHNGYFELRGSCPLPASAELVLERRGHLRDNWVNSPDRLGVFLEPGPVMVNSTDSVRTARVSGGPLTADYQRFRASLQPWLEAKKVRNLEYQRKSEVQRKDPAFIKQRQAQDQAHYDEYNHYTQTFIRANPTSWVSLELLTQTRGVPRYAEVAPLYEAFSPALKNSAPSRKYGEMLRGLKAVTVGAQAPGFTQPTPTGQPVALANYRGKYVLVDFWASWCGPCRAENPFVTKAYQTYKSRNFAIVSVSLDEDRAKWLKAIEEDLLPWTQVSDLQSFESEVARRYSIHAIPQNFLIDPSGKIVAANLRGDALQATLAKLLK